MNPEYPTKEDLALVEKIGLSPKGVLEVLNTVSHWGNEARITRWYTNADGETYRYIKYATGGWSGNEDIIGALSKSIFWLKYWYSTNRGGLFIFKIDKEDWEYVEED